MTNNSIRAVIDSLNRKTAGDLVTTVALSDNVFLGKVWIQKPKPDDEIGQRPLPHTFYFIKNQEDLYIGAVLDMFHDLHWYVIPKYRKLGYLSQALSTKILPHLLLDRDSITISIDKNAIGEKISWPQRGLHLR